MSDKCKDAVKTAYANRFNDIMILWESDCQGKEYVEDLGNIYEYGLSFDYVAPGTFKNQKEGYFRYQISWGGPSEEFRVYTNLNYKPYKIEFWYLDWFDGACHTLEGKEFDWFSEFFQSFFVETKTAKYEFNKSLEEAGDLFVVEED